jgi:hypothetical protein
VPVKPPAKTVSKLENQPEKSTITSLYKMLSALDLEFVVRPKGAPAVASDLEWQSWVGSTSLSSRTANAV